MTDQGNVKYVGAVLAKGIYIGNTQAANYGDGSVIIPPTVEATTFKQAGFPFGLIFKNNQIDTATIRDVVIQEANLIGAENRMNNSVMRTSETALVTTEADKIMQFAANNNMQVVVSHLLWNTKVPQYVKDKAVDTTLTTNDWKNILKDYIQRPMLHFKQMFIDTGKLQHIAYNVVNEPFLLAADINSGNTGLKKCVWLDKLGYSYMKLAFQYAYEADPTAILFCNEFGFEYGWKKVDAMLKFESECKADGTPLHGWGLQLHTGLGTATNSGIETNLKKLAAGGLKMHISELDVSIRQGMPDQYVLADYPAKEAQQASMGSGVFVSFLKLPKPQQFGITTWGIKDADSYKVIGNNISDYPLYFNNDYSHKLIYKESLKAVNASIAG